MVSGARQDQWDSISKDWEQSSAEDVDLGHGCAEYSAMLRDFFC
jgi:hypothetical protein